MDIQTNLLDLLKRVPTSSEIQEDLLNILQPDLSEQMQKVLVKSLKVSICPETGKKYLCCDFNQFQASYRSPYSNQYVPAIDGGVPSRSLREIEVRANTMFEEYKDSFYKNGISSVYVKETSERSYAVCFAIKKETDNGSTDALHVVDLVYDGHHKILFKLFTRLLVKVSLKGFQFYGSISKTIEEGLNRLEDSKQELTHMIKMIENIEGNLKKYTVNFIQSKSMQVSNESRHFAPENQRKRDRLLLKSLLTQVAKTEIEDNKLTG
jgi:capping protein (actin filament) muscle Z-line, beta